VTIPRMETVTVRYWAAARAAAGTPEEQLRGSTLAEVLAAAQAARPSSERFGAVLAVCSFLVGDVPVGRRDPADVPIAAGDVVEVLPPFAGG
jgi:molybdopterin synthase sulfur carrier subunit